MLPEGLSSLQGSVDWYEISVAGYRPGQTPTVRFRTLAACDLLDPARTAAQEPLHSSLLARPRLDAPYDPV